MDIEALRALLAWHGALSARPALLAAIARSVSSRPDAGPDPAYLPDFIAASAGRCRPDWDAAERALDWRAAAHQRRHLVPFTDSRYPAQLREIPSPPLILFVDGDLGVLEREQFAIVGSRRATRGAREFAHAIAAGLARRAIVIGSGLALGIDAAAHRGALSVDGYTVAVLGCGIDRVYPAGHRALAHDIAGRGALMSEFPLGAAPLKHHFPQRNRLIAGLCRGTLVVEAALRSGSISTAMHALEQGRDVFAVPGSVHNPLSAGCHGLIQQGAKLTVGLEDILVELDLPAATSEGPASSSKVRGNSAMSTANDAGSRRLLAACEWAPTTIDVLVQRSGLTVQEVSSMLLALELAGLIESRSNGTYVRIR